MRINKASDDAAGLAVAASLNTNSRVYTRAIRNIDDGLSALTIADGALNALTAIVTRQLELAEQAANGSYSTDQRVALDKEAAALTQEFNRIIDSTSYNDFKLLDNSTQRMAIQAGMGNTSQIEFSLTDKLVQTVGTGTFGTAATVSTGASSTPVSSVSADLDGDGDIDIVTANSGANTVSIMINNGSGIFTLGSTLTAQDRVSEVRIGDFNEDGKLDVLAADYGATGTGTTVSIFAGNGNGTFQAGVQSTVGIGPSAAAIGDVNNDGDIDVVTTTATINFISGLPEITSVTLPTNGVTQINTVTFTGISAREVTSITAAAVGVREVSSLTAVAIAEREVTQLDLPDASNITSGQYFTISSGGTDYYAWFNVDGAGGDPAPGGTGIQIDINSTDTADQVATAVAAALSGTGAFGTSTLSNSVTVTNSTGGAVTDTANVNVGGAFTATTLTQGTNSPLSAGDYFRFNTASGSYYVWFRINGTGSDPMVLGTGLAVDVNWGDSAATVATAIAAVIDPLSDAAASAVGTDVTITNSVSGNVTDISDVNIGAPFSVSVSTQGTNSPIAAGDYFTFDTPSGNYYAWFRIAGTGTDPSVGGRTGVAIDVNWGDSANSVAAAIAGALDPLAPVTATAVGSAVTLTNVTGGSVTDAADVNVGAGFSISVSTQGTTTGIGQSGYFTIDTPSTDYYVWFNINGGGVDPSVGGRTGVRIDVNWGDSANTVAAAVAAAVNPLLELNSGAVGAVTTITGTIHGVGSVAAGTLTGQTINTTQTGVTPPITTGQYFLLNSSTTQYYVWYNVDGGGGDPGVAGRTGIQVNIATGDSGTSIATATAAAIDARAELVATSSTATVTITDTNNAPVTNASNFNVGSATITTTQNGGVSAVDPVANTITAQNHGLSTGAALQLTTTGSLPGGLSTATTYYAIAVDANTLKFATSLGNAMANIAIDITSFGSGTHSLSSAGNTSGGSLVLGNGNGTFQSVNRFALGFSASSLQLVDINNDGKLDLLGTDNQANTAAVLLGRGNGTFSSPTTFATGTAPYSLQTGDFNHDGKLDIAVADQGNNTGTTVSVLLGDGAGGFAARTAYTVGTGPRDIAIADVNGDGNLDIVSANRGAGAGTTASTLLGNGDGTFQTAKTSTTPSGPIALTLDDYNGDGAVDLATVQSAGNTLAIMLAVTEQTTHAARVDLTSASNARSAMGVLTATMNRVNQQRATIGASQSRLMTARSVAMTQREELSRAASRITDADVAQTVAEFAHRTILEKFRVSLLAHAAMSPAVAIDLIKNVDRDNK